MLNMFPIVRYITVFLFLLTFSYASQGVEFRQGENVVVSGQFSQSLFLSGEQVRSEAQSSDDIFMAGGNVAQIGGGADNLFVAGGDIELRNPKVRLAVMAGGNLLISQMEVKDLILAGGSIQVNQSQIQDDMVLAAGKIDIAADSKVNDSATLAGGKIHFAGRAGGDVEISGNLVELTGTFSKNVRVRADRLVVGPNAQINGNLSHQVQSLAISPSAQIQGRSETIPLSEPFQRGGWVQVWAFFAGMLILIGTMLAPAVVAFIFPGFVRGAANTIRYSFWESVGKGTVAFILGPLFLFFLFASVVGVPVALFAGPFFVVAALMAWTIATFAAGRQLGIWYRRDKQTEIETRQISRTGTFGWTVLGALALMICFLVPFLGFILCFILFLAGLGSIYMQMRGRRPSSPIREAEPEKSGGFVSAGSQV